MSDPVVDTHDARLEALTQVTDRYLDVACAVRILVTINPGVKPLLELRDAINGARNSVDALQGTPPDDAEFIGQLESTVADVMSVERKLMEIESSVDIPALRRGFATYDFADEWVARYIAMLTRNLRDNAERRDRIDFLATRLLSRRLPDGRREMRPFAEVDEFLPQMFQAEDIDLEALAQVLKFFEEQVAKLQEFDSLNDLFESGFYLDVRGFKQTLENELLEPDILHGAATLNTAIHNCIEDLAAKGRHTQEDIRERLAEQDAQAKAVLGGGEEPEPDVFQFRFDDQREELKKKKPRRKQERRVVRTREGATLSRRRLVVQVAFGAVVLGLGGYLAQDFLARRKNQLVQSPTLDLSALSPLLERGRVAVNAGLFIGHFRTQDWIGMKPNERRAEAESLARNLAQEDLENAVIYRDDVLTLQIEKGQVVFVE